MVAILLLMLLAIDLLYGRLVSPAPAEGEASNWNKNQRQAIDGVWYPECPKTRRVLQRKRVVSPMRLAVPTDGAGQKFKHQNTREPS
jgi:hypothetical protein